MQLYVKRQQAIMDAISQKCEYLTRLDVDEDDFIAELRGREEIPEHHMTMVWRTLKR